MTCPSIHRFGIGHVHLKVADLDRALGGRLATFTRALDVQSLLRERDPRVRPPAMGPGPRDL